MRSKRRMHCDWKLGLLVLSLSMNFVILNMKMPAQRRSSAPSQDQNMKQQPQSLHHGHDVKQLHQSAVTLKEMTSREALCERFMGLGLVEEYRSSSADWCTPQDDSSSLSRRQGGNDHQRENTQSRIRCYSIEYPWQSIGTFCEGFNIMVDFSRIRSQPLDSHRDAYLNFYTPAFTAECTKVQSWASNQRLLSIQQEQQFRTFKTGRRQLNHSETVSETSYLLVRHNDVDNMFHSTGDWINMELVYRVLDIAPEEAQVVLWERFPMGWHEQALKPAFTTRPVRRASDWGKKKVLFRHVVWGLEAPGNIVEPSKTVPYVAGRHLTCFESSLVRAFGARVLGGFGLFDVDPPPIPHITLSVRVPRANGRNIGRVLVNQAAVESVLREGNMLTWESVDMGSLSFAQQLAQARRTSVLAGIHGAGLTWVIFLAGEAVLVELHPSYRLDRHFRHLARLSGKVYLPMRAPDAIACNGTSDRITVSIPEFRNVMDGALRVARGFDDGVAECGLTCPPEILALDATHDAFYNITNTRRVARPDLQFPCPAS